MADALQKPVTPRSDDWITVQQAALDTKRSEDCWRKRAKRESQDAIRAGRTPLAKMQRGDNGLKSQWFVHRSIDPRLESKKVSRWRSDEEQLNALRYEVPGHIIDKAKRMLACIKRWWEACDRGIGESRKSQLADRHAKEAGVCRRTLYHWADRYQKDGVQGLIDLTGCENGIPTRAREAVEFFYGLYHTENKLSKAECHRRTLAAARKNGWHWPESERATCKWLDKHDDLGKTCLMREGKGKWSRRYMEYLEQDWAAIEPGELFVSDHKQTDFFVQYKGKAIRPWLTAVQDGRSRCIVGWHLGPAPHTDAILAAMRMAFRDWAVPRAMRLDNGRDYASQLLTGETKAERRARKAMRNQRDWFDRLAQVDPESADPSRGDNRVWLGVLPELDIDLIFAIPYHPWSKGIIERWFRTFNEQCGKMFATWCGDKAENKPECHAETLADAPTLEEAREVIEEYITERYHHDQHEGWGVNQTPLNTWESAATELRRADEAALAMVMNIRGAYKVGGNGVSVTVSSGKLKYGRSCAALKRYKGREVLVAVDPDRIDHAYAIDPQTRRLIGRLDLNERVHPLAGIQDAREAISQTLRDQALAARAQRNSIKRTRSLVQTVNRQKFSDLTARATGTDDVSATAPPPIIQPVATGFESFSQMVQRLPEAPSTKLPDGSDFARRMREWSQQPEPPPGESLMQRPIAAGKTERANERKKRKSLEEVSDALVPEKPKDREDWANRGTDNADLWRDKP